ncbi:Small glutamine-rich tetratricopeptide repeat-containing protein 2 [Dimargaris cristalligena]|nr:Small glutamine-rich tetratricopeptide repeat-containing protein 2 [Dimargaris cristalligena]
MDDTQRKLVVAIIDYLQGSIANNTVHSSNAESLEVAIDCIAESFGVDLSDEAQRSQLSIKPATLQNVFDIYLKTQDKMAAKKTASSNDSASGASDDYPAPLTDEQKAKAEELKAAGNKALSSQQYADAIRLYTEAIAINPHNHIYFANRSAAYSQSGDFNKSVDDANAAIRLAPQYAKAYSRLAHAYYGLKQFDLAVKAYDQCLELEPNNANIITSRSVAQRRLEESDAAISPRSEGSDSQAATTTSSADGSSSANTGEAGARGPGAGMDFNGLLNNPALMNMASQMMGNGGLANLMSNPAIRQMAQSMMGGGAGGGDSADPMASMMNNPQMREMAQQFMSGNNPGGADSDNPMAAFANNPDLRGMAEQFMRGQGNNNQ